MERLYKRLVTVGMITVSAILAWIYCILEYRDESLYIIGASLVVVASLYVLLLTTISLKNSKETMLHNYISETIATNLLKMQKNGDQEDVIRLLKAMYVQIRKRNAVDMNTLVAESINKAAKAIIKYNQSNNDAMLATIANLTTELDAIKAKLDNMKVATPSAEVVPQDIPSEEVSSDDFTNDTNLDMFQTETEAAPEEAVTSEEATPSVDDLLAAADAPVDDGMLAASFFEAFGAEEEQTKEDAVADVIPFPSSNTESTDPVEPTTIANPE